VSDPAKLHMATIVDLLAIPEAHRRHAGDHAVLS
jgi:hypothetical protein